MRKIILFLIFVASLKLSAQSYNYTKDIENKYLDKIVVNNNDSTMIQYRDFAIDLFAKGTNINDSLWKNIKKNLVGVCLFAEKDSENNRTVSFNLYGLNYKDDRIEDFHKRIYFGEGSEAITCFYVKCNTDTEVNLLNSAIDSYLKKDSIPVDNPAYQFSRNFSSTDYSENIFKSDSLSTIAMGYQCSYLRQNGNYLIQIEGAPEDESEADTEKIYSTSYFFNNWHTITVYIIDEKDGKAYHKVFE